MARNMIITYNPRLKVLARKLRSNSTKAETRLWKYIKCRTTGFEFHRQVPIDESIVDFYCHELKMAIEVDGYTHDFNYKNDELRQRRLEEFGIKFIRFYDEDVLKHITEVLREIQSKIEGIEHPPDPPAEAGQALQRGRKNIPPTLPPKRDNLFRTSGRLFKGRDK